MLGESRAYRVALLAFFILPLVVTTLAFVSLANTSPNDLAVATPTPSPTPATAELVEVGAAAYAAGNFVEAERLLRAALMQMPDSAELHNSLGLAMLAQDKHTDAHAQFTHATELDPTLADAHFNLARTNHHLESWDEAEAYYLNALEQTEEPIYYHELGNLYHDLDDDDAAEEAYLLALELDSALVESYLNLSTLYANGDDHDAAIAHLEQVLTLDSSHHAARHNLGTLHAFRGDAQQARAAWEAIIADDVDGEWAELALEALEELED